MNIEKYTLTPVKDQARSSEELSTILYYSDETDALPQGNWQKYIFRGPCNDFFQLQLLFNNLKKFCKSKAMTSFESLRWSSCKKSEIPHFQESNMSNI